MMALFLCLFSTLHMSCPIRSLVRPYSVGNGIHHFKQLHVTRQWMLSPRTCPPASICSSRTGLSPTVFIVRPLARSVAPVFQIIACKPDRRIVTTAAGRCNNRLCDNHAPEVGGSRIALFQDFCGKRRRLRKSSSMGGRVFSFF